VNISSAAKATKNAKSINFNVTHVNVKHVKSLRVAGLPRARSPTERGPGERNYVFAREKKKIPSNAAR
jgi:hypothetical protein